MGFVLIKVSGGRERSVYDALLYVAGVVEVFPLFGEYDLLAKVEAPTFDQLGGLVVGTVRIIPGVTETKTLTATKL